MKKYILTAFAFAALLGGSVTFTSCEDEATVQEMELGRLLSPTNLVARVRNTINIELSWNAVSNAQSYTIEVFNNDPEFAGSPIQTIETGNLSYLISGLDGEETYNLRVKATAEGENDSKWSSIERATDPAQVFFPLEDGDVTFNSVTLRWPEGEVTTKITLTPTPTKENPNPTDIVHTVTPAEIAAGEVTIEGLTERTNYTAVMVNGEKTRGTMVFKTAIDPTGKTLVYEGDDLIAVLDAFNEGDHVVIVSGEFSLGNYAITKSLKISGLESNDKPTIYGQFTCSVDVSSVELTSLIFRGDENPGSLVGQFFNMGTTEIDKVPVPGSIDRLSLVDCEIGYYTNQLIYNNVVAAVGDVLISNCIIHDIPGSGGDGIDFRGGTLGSMTVENTTFNNTFRTFLRMQAKSGPISFVNCTFNNAAAFDNSNNHGFFRIADGTSFEVRNCLFTNGIDKPGTTMGNFCRQDSNMKLSGGNPVYANNVYFNSPNLWLGKYTDPSACSAIELDPQFVDPTNGDFTVGNQDVIDTGAGDPRWLP